MNRKNLNWKHERNRPLWGGGRLDVDGKVILKST
jgi:hypothetical protein